VPVGRALTEGACGRCKKPIATEKPVEIDGRMLRGLKTGVVNRTGLEAGSLGV
jgi:hypothetical protein